jgi:hypothetical protein
MKETDVTVYRTKCGAGRVSYAPVFCETKPWAVFLKGTCFQRAFTLGVAKSLLRAKRCRL